MVVQKLQEITVEDRRHLLDAHQGELKIINQRISEISRRLAGDINFFDRWILINFKLHYNVGNSLISVRIGQEPRGVL